MEGTCEESGATLQVDTNRDQNIQKFRRCFQDYYAKLCSVLPINESLPSLVSCGVVTMNEMLNIEAKETTSLKARALLNGPVWRAIDGGYPDTFIRLLCVMRSLRICSCVELCDEICVKLGISSEVISKFSSE